MANPEPEVPEGRRLVGVSFVHAASFDSRMSLSIEGGNRTCESIQPAKLNALGEAVVIDKGERSDGLLIRRRLGAPKPRIVRNFVPWANVTDLAYAE